MNKLKNKQTKNKCNNRHRKKERKKVSERMADLLSRSNFRSIVRDWSVQTVMWFWMLSQAAARSPMLLTADSRAAILAVLLDSSRSSLLMYRVLNLSSWPVEKTMELMWYYIVLVSWVHYVLVMSHVSSLLSRLFMFRYSRAEEE